MLLSNAPIITLIRKSIFTMGIKRGIFQLFFGENEVLESL